MKASRILLGCVLTIATPLAAQVRVTHKTVGSVAPNDGRALYMTLCASCHGTDLAGVPQVQQSVGRNMNIRTLSAHYSPDQLHYMVRSQVEFGSDGFEHPLCMPAVKAQLREMYRGDHNRTVLAIKNLTDFIVAHQR